MAETESGNQNVLRASWLKRTSVVTLVNVLSAGGEDCVRFVGGCVRNTLMGEETTDIDLATVHRPERVVELLGAADIRVIPTGIDHGTVTALVEGENFEITTLRSDVKTDGRRATVAFTDDWTQDAQRRDFTMNAIYADAGGKIFDPVGGVADAKARVVRFIGDPSSRIREDYLRILRFFRFYARYGKEEPDKAGLQACAAEVEGISRLSGERVQVEVLKLLATDNAVSALRYMAASDVLTAVLPEVQELGLLAKLIELETTQLFECDEVLRLAVLIGPRDDAVQSVAERLKLSNAVRDRLTRLARDDTKIVSYASPREIRQALYRMGTDLFRDRIRLNWAADPKLSNSVQWRTLLELGKTWERPTLPLSGEQVMAAGVPEGPDIGRVLAEVEDWWIENDFIEDEFSIIERLKAIVQATVL